MILTFTTMEYSRPHDWEGMTHDETWNEKECTNTHRIHVCYIWYHGSHQYTPVMLAYIPAPWILWDMVPYRKNGETLSEMSRFFRWEIQLTKHERNGIWRSTWLPKGGQGGKKVYPINYSYCPWHPFTSFKSVITYNPIYGMITLFLTIYNW